MKKRRNQNNKSTLSLLVISRGLTYFKREEGRVILKRISKKLKFERCVLFCRKRSIVSAQRIDVFFTISYYWEKPPPAKVRKLRFHHDMSTSITA